MSLCLREMEGQRGRRERLGYLIRRREEPLRQSHQERGRRPLRRRQPGACCETTQETSTTTRFLYQPHTGHTVCGLFALPQRGQVLRAGADSFQLLARRLRVFDFEVFFFGTAT